MFKLYFEGPYGSKKIGEYETLEEAQNVPVDYEDLTEEEDYTILGDFPGEWIISDKGVWKYLKW